jgi:hypothetical protein
LCTKYFFHTCRVLLYAIKSYGMGPVALLHFRKKVCCGFLLPRQGLNPQTLGPVASTLPITPLRQLRGAFCLYHQGSGGCKHLWNVIQFPWDYTLQHIRRQSSYVV